MAFISYDACNLYICFYEAIVLNSISVLRTYMETTVRMGGGLKMGEASPWWSNPQPPEDLPYVVKYTTFRPCNFFFML